MNAAVGSDFNDGKASDAFHAWASLGKCNAALAPGDSCNVIAGRIYGDPIRPRNSGLASAPIAYRCATGDCRVDVASGRGLDLDGRSYVVVEGFDFTDDVRAWGGTSRSVVVRNIGVTGGANIQTECGTDNLLEDFVVVVPPAAASGPTALSVAVGCSAGESELRSTFRNGIVRGGWNTLQMSQCDACVFDGLDVSEARNHTFTMENGAGVTVKNSIIGPGTHFKEHLDNRSNHSLTLLNNLLFVGIDPGGFNLPSTATGSWTIRNNVFLDYGFGSTGLLNLNDGSGGGTNTATYDIDYNAYVSVAPFPAYRPMWHYDIGAEDVAYLPDPDGDGVMFTAAGGCDDPAPNFCSWRSGRSHDAHSIVVANRDFRSGPQSYSETLWGGAGITWAGALGVGCAHTTSDLLIDAAWGREFAAGDLVEWNRDGALRRVAAVAGGGAPGCEYRVSVDPPLALRPADATWLLSWGRQDPDGDGRPNLAGPISEVERRSYEPAEGSPLIDAGDPARCGHAPSGSACDIGPVERYAGSLLPVLSVGLAGTGSGTVLSSPWGIDCGAACRAEFEAGTEVVLSGLPDAASAPAVWLGDADCSDGVVTMGGDVSCTAVFDRRTQVLHVAPVTDGCAVAGSALVDDQEQGADRIVGCAAGGGDCSATYDAGSYVTLTANTTPGCEVAAWGGDCAPCAGGAVPTCRIAMDSDRACSVTYAEAAAPAAYSLTLVRSTGIGAYSDPPGILCPGDCTAESIPAGATYTLYARAKKLSVVPIWGGACQACGRSKVCKLTVSANTICTVSRDGAVVQEAP